ncbi:SCO4402 family protein [Streptomyces rubiginosohelvolus]
MEDDRVIMARARMHLVPAVLALANPPWQRDVWLDPEVFEDLGYVLHTLFDDFCDAEHPERYLGIGLRSEEEVVLLRELDRALTAAEDQAPDDSDAEMLRVEGWAEVVAVAGRLAQVMVANDLGELLALQEARGAAEA